MSAIVTQLTFSINEKLRIDDRNFSSFTQHSKQDAVPVNKPVSTSTFPSKEPCGQWMSSTVASGGSPQTNPTTHGTFPSAPYTSIQHSPERTLTPSATLVGVACPIVTSQGQHVTQQAARVGSCFTRKELTRQSKLPEATEITFYDLQQNKPIPAITTRGAKVNRSATTATPSDRPFQFTGSSSPSTSGGNSFPSVVGRSCTLHSPKKPPSSSPHPLHSSDIPPLKRHCRSVSEPEEMTSFMMDPISSSCRGGGGVPSSWKPASRVWVPFRRLHQQNRRAYSSSSSNGDCSRSLDCSSVASVAGESLLTPPSSPVPRPASVTVIKQESGSWTCLASHHPGSSSSLIGNPPPPPPPCSFSPLSPMCQISSPSSSSRSTDAGGWTHSGLSATKRSLSFSDDFEHRESIHYTPSSTPDLERRFEVGSVRHGGLLRCQSHPSDLNTRRSRSGRRRALNKLVYQRPALDLAKMKQTSVNKRIKVKECGKMTEVVTSTPMWTATPTSPECGKVPTVRPVFPSTVEGECSNAGKKFHTHSATPTFMFTISPAPMSHIRDVSGRIPSPTDELPGECDDVMDEGELHTAPGGVDHPFVPSCDDLSIDEIENESGDEI